MINNTRLDMIRSVLKTDHKVRVVDLSQKLEVVEETIRRDLKYLESLGELRRVHGGAILAYIDEEQPLDTRSKIRPKDKIKIAESAISLIEDGMAIFLDTGTTTLALAQKLTQFKDLKIITNSLDIAQLMALDQKNTVYVIPGKVRCNDNAIIGEQSIQFLSQYNYDLAFMGIGAISAQHGFMDYNEAEAFIRRKIIQYSQKRIILADESKFMTKAFINTFGFDQIDILITNKKPQVHYLEALEKHDVQLIYK